MAGTRRSPSPSHQYNEVGILDSFPKSIVNELSKRRNCGLGIRSFGTHPDGTAHWSGKQKQIEDGAAVRVDFRPWIPSQ